MKGTWKKFAVIMKYLEFLAAGYLLERGQAQTYILISKENLLKVN